VSSKSRVSGGASGVGGAYERTSSRSMANPASVSTCLSGPRGQPETRGDAPRNGSGASSRSAQLSLVVASAAIWAFFRRPGCSSTGAAGTFAAMRRESSDSGVHAAAFDRRPASAEPASARLSDVQRHAGRAQGWTHERSLVHVRDKYGDDYDNQADPDEEAPDSKPQKEPQRAENIQVVHGPHASDCQVRTSAFDRPKLVVAKPTLIILTFKTAMIGNSCRVKRSLV
jgi:hypothetical protein